MKNKSLAEYIVEIDGKQYVPYSKAVEAIMQSVSREVREALDEVSSGMKDVNNLLEDND
jgi:hypothetical protein|tara:strand:- start:2030 stop:2206 length:177 start_codon:yes stop_codon:yes gene_type:complete